MKKHIIATGVLALSIVGSSYADNWAPYFHEDGYIKMAAQGALCGVFNIRATKGNVHLMAQKFQSSVFSNTIEPREVTSKESETSDALGWVPLGPGGIRVRYDWAGGYSDSHYRIFCTTEQVGKKQIVNCKEYIEIDGINHNTACVSWQKKQYPPLYMNKG